MGSPARRTSTLAGGEVGDLSLLLFFFHRLQFGSQLNQGLLVLKENRDQNRLKRPRPRSIDPGLYMKPCLLKEPVEELLIFFPQASPEFSPFLDFLLQYPA